MPSYNVEHVHDELFGKANWVIGDLPNGTFYLGANKSLTATAANASWFDARPYNRVQVWATLGGLGGGTSPSIEVNLEHGVNEDAALASLGSTYRVLSSDGGTICLQAGSATAYIELGGAAYSQQGAGSPHCPPFFRIRLYISGGATSLTAPGFRLYAYGIG